LTKDEVRNSSRTRVVEYFINNYFYSNLEETLSNEVKSMLVILDKWFAKNNKDWQISKVYEEYGEATEAFKEWKKSGNEYSRFHVIVEVSDFIAAFSSFVKRYIGSVDMEDIINEDSEFESMLGNIKRIIETVNITSGEIVTNIENKFAEIYVGIVTYQKLTSGNDNDILCKVIKTLYTDKEIKDKSNEKKIVKEIRRMWYAREFTKIFD